MELGTKESYRVYLASHSGFNLYAGNGDVAGEPVSPAGRDAFAALRENLLPALRRQPESSLLAAASGMADGLSEEQNIALLEKTAKALNPGGIAVILEQFGTNLPLPMSRAANNILGLSYYHLLGGQVYSYEQVESWFRAAGYSNLKRINLRKVPGNSLIIGEVITLDTGIE